VWDLSGWDYFLVSVGVGSVRLGLFFSVSRCGICAAGTNCSSSAVKAAQISDVFFHRQILHLAPGVRTSAHAGPWRGWSGGSESGTLLSCSCYRPRYCSYRTAKTRVSRYFQISISDKLFSLTLKPTERKRSAAVERYTVRILARLRLYSLKLNEMVSYAYFWKERVSNYADGLVSYITD
jgi:hypothetical protein